MPHRTFARPDAQTPIERIFEKVMRRKMTAGERKALHLKVSVEHRFVKTIDGAALQFKLARN